MEHVGPEDEEQLGLGMLVAKVPERVDSVVHPPTVNLAAADREPFVPGNGQLQHGEP
jgi:hypothetical protein